MGQRNNIILKKTKKISNFDKKILIKENYYVIDFIPDILAVI